MFLDSSFCGTVPKLESMSASTNALPLPTPEGDNQPNLNVLPPVAPKRSPYALSKADEREIALAKLLVTSALIPAYGLPLQGSGITAAFLSALNSDLALARQCSERAVNCTNAKEGATASEAEKRTTLVHSLRTIQSKARAAYQDTNPQHVKDYLTGEDIVSSRPVLEGAAQTIIDKANVDRPAGLDTNFIQRATDERQAYIDAHAAQQTELGKAKQERVSRNQLIASIRERRCSRGATAVPLSSPANRRRVTYSTWSRHRAANCGCRRKGRR